MIQLNVDTNATIIFTNKLEKISKSAFPIAVRNALNSAAFDVKKNTLLRSAEKNFEKRSPNFFKANSRVEMAKGWNLDEMNATVGMVDLGGNNYAIDDLEQQEYGGQIGGKAFIPMDPARTSKSYSKGVQKKNRITGIKNIISSKKGSQNFAKSIIQAGEGGVVLSSKGILFRVNSIKKRKFKLTPLFSYRKGRKVKVQPTHFMSSAATESGSKIDDFYIASAEREFEKALR